MNKWIGIGRLTEDPETRYSQGTNTAVTRFRIAVDRRFKRDGEPTADFIPCLAFGKTAEFIEKYFSKGMKIAVTGHLQTGSYTNREGQKVYTWDVVLDEAEFCESKKQEEAPEIPPKSPVDADGFMSIPDGFNEELPFV